MKPHDYQRKGILNIINKHKEFDKVLFQLDTGGGKTVVFSFLCKYWKEKINKKVLILCHRTELVDQTVETLVKIGLTAERILPNVKKYHHTADVYVAMVETINNRLKKNKFFLKNVGLVIADECHIQVFNKVFEYFKNEKILGVTATPVLTERETFYRCGYCNTEYKENTLCCGIETMEWSRPITLSQTYSDIVIGSSIDFLIQFGQLVKEINYNKTAINIDDLKIDNTGEYSKESLDKAYNTEEASFNVLLNYEEICKGKRTIIFNANSKSNLLVYQKFKEKGYNVKLYDSVNDTDLSRKELVKWFNENDDAILCNVNIFTTGFDSKEVQSIILNRATTSLSLYLQMVGRGGRASTKIYKDNFIVIDGGGNIDRFDPWSSNTRDWRKIFFEGLSKEKPKKETPQSVKECKKCYALIARSVSICPECNFQEPTKTVKEKTENDIILKPLDKIPYPNGEKIYKYTLSRNENIHFAHKILINQILDLFILHQVSKELYLSTLNNGNLEKKINKMIRSCYFYLLGKKDIHSGQNRKLSQLVEKCKEKIKKHYDNK